MRKTKVLLTGASGTVGSEVLKQLLAQKKYELTVFDKKTKRSEKRLTKYKNQVNLVFGDIGNASDVEKVSHNQDFVIHLAAIIPPLADEQPDLAELVNVQGSKNLITALGENSKDAFLLYASSVSVYGDRLINPDIRTTDQICASGRDEYAKTKIKVEGVLRESKLKWSIFRLTAIMGAGNHKITGLMFEMPLKTSIEICTPEDTARSFVKAIENEEALVSKTFNLGGGVSCRITYEDFMARMFQIYGLGKVNFPEYSFAEKNFHCGNYVDGDDLEQLLQFRNQNLEDYFDLVKASVSPLQKFATNLVKYPVKKYLLTLSHPRKSYKNQNAKDLEYYFNSIQN